MGRHRPVTAIIVLVLLLVAASAASGQLIGSYTLDPNGSGARNFTTWAAAISTLSVGISGPVNFKVASATFREAPVFPPIPGAFYSSRITFAAVGAPAVVDATGSLDGITLQQNSGFLVFKNLVVQGGSRTALRVNGTFTREPRDCHFENVQFVGPPPTNRFQSAAWIFYATDFHFLRCRFRGGDNVLDIVLTNRSTFEACEFDGLGAATRLIFPRDARGTPYLNSHDCDNRWSNCYIHSCRPRGSRAIHFDLSHDRCIVGNMFWHNTIIVKSREPALRLDCWGWASCQSFRNNIVVNLGTGPCVAYGARAGQNVPWALDCNDLDFNCYYAPNAKRGTVQLTDGSFGGTLAEWKTLLANNRGAIAPGGGEAYDDHSIEINPGLVKLTPPYDFHLRHGSPCQDAGTSTYVAGPWVTYPRGSRVAADLDGHLRPSFGVDIGADETSNLQAAGTGRVGTSVSFSLLERTAGGLAYQLASSLGPGPNLFGGHQLGLDTDALFWVSTSGALPGIFGGYRGVFRPSGQAHATLRIPPIPSLVGRTIHTAYVTLRASSPHLVTVSQTTAVRIIK